MCACDYVCVNKYWITGSFSNKWSTYHVDSMLWFLEISADEHIRLLSWKTTPPPPPPRPFASLFLGGKKGKKSDGSFGQGEMLPHFLPWCAHSVFQAVKMHGHTELSLCLLCPLTPAFWLLLSPFSPPSFAFLCSPLVLFLQHTHTHTPFPVFSLPYLPSGFYFQLSPIRGNICNLKHFYLLQNKKEKQD